MFQHLLDRVRSKNVALWQIKLHFFANMPIMPMPMIRADGALIRRRCFARADKRSGTCPSGTAEPPRKATFIATLRCKTVSGQACHRLADALRSIGPRAARLPRRLAPTALIRKSGHGEQSVVPLAPLAPQLPAHRAGPSPLAPQGEDNHPGDGVPTPPSVRCKGPTIELPDEAAAAEPLRVAYVSDF